MFASPEFVVLQQAQAQDRRTVITTPDGKRTTIINGPSGKQIVVENDPNAPVAAIPAVPAPPAPPAIAGSLGTPFQPVIPPQAVQISQGFFFTIAAIIIGWPIARAYGRRIERRSEVSPLGAGAADQLQRIEQAVDTMAIEVERISESQRFLAKLQSERQAERLPR